MLNPQRLALLAGSLLIALSACAPEMEALEDQAFDPASYTAPLRHRLRVKIVTLDPYVTRPDGTRVRLRSLHAGWQADVPRFARQIAADLSRQSHNTVSVEVVAEETSDVLPAFENGTRYTGDQLEEIFNATPEQRYRLRPGCTGSIDRPTCQDWVDYRAISRDFRLAEGVAAGQFDEAWFLAPPWAGFYESRMLGGTSYWCNGPEERRVGGKNFVVMGLNYERGLESALHAYGHRAESILDHVYGGRVGVWGGFAANELTAAGQGGLGTVHVPVNGEREYDYGNARSVTSSVRAWEALPLLATSASPRSNVACSAWGCTELGYMQWWFNRMPYGQPNAPDWWANIAMLQGRVDESLPKDCTRHSSQFLCLVDSACGWSSCTNRCILRGTSTCGAARDAGMAARDASAPPAGPVCGNARCESGESCSSCARDCGSCPARDAGVPSAPDASAPAMCPAGTYAIWTCNSALTARVRCLNGMVSTESCPSGCEVRPVGTDDVCRTASAPTCPAGTYAIWTCNSARTARVRCINGVVSTENCARGCTVRPVGTDDVCN